MAQNDDITDGNGFTDDDFSDIEARPLLSDRLLPRIEGDTAPVDQPGRRIPENASERVSERVVKQPSEHASERVSEQAFEQAGHHADRQVGSRAEGQAGRYTAGQAERHSAEQDAEREGRRQAGKGGRRSGHRGHRAKKDAGERAPKKPNFIVRITNHWFDRVMGAVRSGEISGQEEYASHRTTRDFIWNTVGVGAWGMVFPILTIVATQLAGVEKAGMFSMAFVTGTLLMILANFGVRTYQVSDVEERHSFSDYQINRWITCVAMVLIGVAYCNIRGYDSEMFYISIGVYLYRMVDGLADVYEGRLQQADKLYLAGISQAIRSVAALVVFSVLLFVTRNMVVASFGMAIVAFVTFVVVTLPLAMMETPKSRKASFASIAQLFKECAPLFVALFLYSLIDNMPKFVMEGTLSYDNQLYFNALYFPAQGILLTVQLVYKPLLVRMANVWNDPASRKKFTVIVIGIFLLIIAVTVVNVVVMGWIGLPIMSFLYGIDFEQFRGLCFIMLAAGGVTAAIDFLYQVITVMRRQKSVMKLYIITFGFSLFVPMLLIMFTGLPGAALAYLIVMTILFVLLVWEYFRILSDLAKNGPRGDGASGGSSSGSPEGTSEGSSEGSSNTASGNSANVADGVPEGSASSPSGGSVDGSQEGFAKGRHSGFAAAGRGGMAGASKMNGTGTSGSGRRSSARARDDRFDGPEVDGRV